MNIFKFFRNKRYKNAEMVSYWRTQESVEAKVYKSKEGHYEMQMSGEKYPFPGYPRGSLLYGSLSPLKHLIKNKVFNEIHANADISCLKNNLYKIFTYADIGKDEDIASRAMSPYRFDMVPYELMVPPVKEIWRAMTAIENGNKKIKDLKEIICFILQEDDAYRFRFQWMTKFFPRWKKPTIEQFDFALSMIEHAEIVGDMKERQRLFKKILMFSLKDKNIKAHFERLLTEMDWSKLRLSKADKYFFRAKHFKVDYPEFDY